MQADERIAMTMAVLANPLWGTSGSGVRGIIDAGEAPRPRPTMRDLRHAPVDSIAYRRLKRKVIYKRVQVLNPGSCQILNPDADIDSGFLP